MDQELLNIFADATHIQLIAMLAGAIFFAAIGFRCARDEHVEIILYYALAAFFFCGHAFCLLNLPVGFTDNADISFWYWLVRLFAPALMIMLIAFSLFSFVTYKFHQGTVKLFFGLTLFCYLYMLGFNWAVDIRGIITLVYSGIWVQLELSSQ